MIKNLIMAFIPVICLISILAFKDSGWRGSVQANSSAWVKGPKLAAGDNIVVFASGTVCCAQPKIHGFSKKCRTPDTDAGEGHLLIKLPGDGSIIRYESGISLNIQTSGYLRFIIEDSKHEDNSGSYSIDVDIN